MNKFKPLFLPPPYQEAADHGRVILRDGSTAMLRVSQPGDLPALQAFFQRLSPESRQRRFFAATGPAAKFVAHMADSSDPTRQLTLVVTRWAEGENRIIATASYLARDERAAEFAVAVDDESQGKGLGTILLERLAVVAAMNGFVQFIALTLQENQPMLEIFRKSGFQLREGHEDGYVSVDLSVEPSEESVKATEMRDRVFTAASLRPFFRPRSVAVIGASRTPNSIGYRIMEALVMNRFQGPVYPVNPQARVILSIRCYASLREIPDPVDLAVVVVPRDRVLGAIDDCGAKGVRALVVISAGFAETGEAGRFLQQELVEKARGYGMRVIGPNCLGIINTAPEIQLNASFSPVYPPHGRVSMSSQSGALGLAILGLARRMHLGLSSFVSIGNKADVSGNDLLQYWEDDNSTDVILLYLEAFKNPRRFARIARRVSRRKPIVCVKGGRTSAGQRAAGSHTAALAGSDVPVDALFRQTGVIRSDTLAEMFDLAAALANQPLPTGRRVAVVTNAGGPGILCADACEAGGLVLPELSIQTQKSLKEFLPAAAGLSNPVDMIASAPPDHFRRTVETILVSQEVDAMIVIYIPVGVARDEDIMAAIGEGISAARARGSKIPVLAVPMYGEKECPPLALAHEVIPTYPFPESAATVLSKVADYGDWRRQPVGLIPDLGNTQPQKARQICRDALTGRGPGWLTVAETRDVLTSFGLPVPPGGIAATADQAAQLAEQIGYPVAVKLASHRIVHKTEIGGVHLRLRDADAVRRAFDAIRGQVLKTAKPEDMEGVLVQPMMSGGVEVMVGVTEDPLFGPLIAFGLGGIHVEILGDVRFRVTPLTDQDVDEMIREIKGFRLLKGYRGHPPADIEAIRDVLLRISLLVEEIPEINELDLNPIFALPPGEGCRIVDARIGVQPYSPDHPVRYTMASLHARPPKAPTPQTHASP
jgi:acetyl coenzyme A synthetase (ADP forming)-like protein